MASTSAQRVWRDDGTGLRLPLKFPAELRPPTGFRADDPSTWPKVEGRLEYVGGRLLYMPPCADNQSQVAPVVTHLLLSWAEKTPGFIVAGHEAGLILGGETRGADAAVWHAADLPPNRGQFVRVPPLLAVEVEGEDEDEVALRDKAQWYLAHGVKVVWLVLHSTREVVVLADSGESRSGRGTSLPAHSALPGLTPRVDDFFRQLAP